MSLAIDFLTAHFEQPQVTKADFAKAAGIDASLVTNILQGDVQIGPKNLPKLLRGFRNDNERREFLAAHLRDQVPVDFADEVVVHLSHGPALAEPAEGDNEGELEVRLVQAFHALPNASYRERVVKFVQALRKDDALRDLFTRTMRFIEDSPAFDANALIQRGAQKLAREDSKAAKASRAARK